MIPLDMRSCNTQGPVSEMKTMSTWAENSLEYALALLAEDWVYSFMFPSGMCGSVPQLKHAITYSQRLLAELEVSVKPSLQPSARVVNIDEHYNLLFLPTFTSGNKTVGFEIIDHTKIANVFTKVPRYVAKFVRDDEKGIILSIAEHPTLGITDVTFGFMSSPGKRDHVLAQFHYATFRKIIFRIGDRFEFSALQQGLVYCYRSVERRPCPTCGNDRETECLCRLPLKEKVHPMDRASEIHNMSVYEGPFRGVADLGVYSEGRSISEVKFVSFSQGRFIVDNDLQEMLLGWALQSSYSPCHRTLSSLTVSKNSQSSNSLHKEDLHHLQNAREIDSLPFGNLSTSGSLLHTERSPSVDVLNMFKGPDLWFNISSDDNGDGSTADAVESFQSNDTGQKVTDEFTSSDALRLIQIQDCNNSDEAGVDGLDSVTSRWLSAASIFDCNQFRLKLTPTSTVSSPSLSSSSPLHANEEVQTSIKELSLFNRHEGTTVPIQAASQDLNLSLSVVDQACPEYDRNSMQEGHSLQPASSATTGRSLSERNGFLDETTRKRELRKARNRESARRSSIRKNLKVQKLQEDLESAKRKEAELRRREQGVRKENLLLRAALHP